MIAGMILVLIPPNDKIEIVIVRAAEVEQTPAMNVALAKRLANAYGWRGKEWRCLHRVWSRESGFRHLVQNRQGSSAFGIAQMLNEKSKLPEVQIVRGLRYVSNRFGSPCRALAFHLRHGYY